MTKITTNKATNYETMNAFLLNVLNQIPEKKINVQQTDAISKIADKIIKNNLTKIMDLKRTGEISAIPFFQPRPLINGNSSNEESKPDKRITAAKKAK